MKEKVTELTVLIAGITISLLDSVPILWGLRLLLAKSLDFILTETLRMFPSIYYFIEGQNRKYKMGKQEDKSMISIIELEQLLEHLNHQNISLSRVKEIIKLAESENITNEDLARFMAYELFDEITAQKVLKPVHTI